MQAGAPKSCKVKGESCATIPGNSAGQSYASTERAKPELLCASVPSMKD